MPSSPPLRWADLAGARVGLWGLGTEGAASRRLLATMGVAPICVEDRPESPDVLAIGAGGLEALSGCEVVVKSPGVSRYRPEVEALEAAGVAVVGGLGLWLEGADRDRVICVTGTKGKSTTVSILGHLLTGLGRPAFTGGNLGYAPFDPDAPDDIDTWVIEVSSYQATDLWSAPPVVGVTSLHADHVDWHGSAARYYADKLSLCTKPGAQHVVANGTDPLLRAHERMLGPAPRWVVPTHGADEWWVAALGLRGEHNHTNAVIAGACLIAYGVVASPDALAAAAAGFDGLPSRLRSILTVDGVEFVDDSLSTNVLPTIAALSVFPDRRVALLVGGFDRRIDYGPLAACLATRATPLLVVALPDNGARIEEAIAGCSPMVEVVRAAGLDDAVPRAWRWARPDGVVLLSPAAPSFGRFTDYRARAAAFAAAAARCETTA